jgi:hypothetical protein
LTPARLATCMRLLKGIAILAERNRIDQQELIARRSHLQTECDCLARSIGDERFADSRLLLSMSRRLAQTAQEFKQCEAQLDSANEANARFDRSRTLLMERVRKHDIESMEEELMEMVSSRVS